MVTTTTAGMTITTISISRVEVEGTAIEPGREANCPRISTIPVYLRMSVQRTDPRQRMQTLHNQDMQVEEARRTRSMLSLPPLNTKRSRERVEMERAACRRTRLPYMCTVQTLSIPPNLLRRSRAQIRPSQIASLRCTMHRTIPDRRSRRLPTMKTACMSDVISRGGFARRTGGNLPRPRARATRSNRIFVTVEKDTAKGPRLAQR